MTVETLIEKHRRVHLPPPVERRRRRKAFGISAAALGEEIGVSGPAISRWERGVREPRGAARVRYAEALAAFARHEAAADGD